ncbi:HNH endonuclease [Lelliottia amnigena]|uniref:HNH endonuclease n=1 Tax=Lelliottia amnigena TaxID=61646 RepID=UPI001C5C8EC2|nr:HNH endonuclease [Lelliottia amnigena]QXZ20851.1 HNH endonuclease [Lelliottia amnigena]
MIHNAVSYNASHNSFISAFKKLTTDEKESYWDTKGNKELDAIKKHIKDYYLISQDYKCPYCQQKIIVAHNGAWDTEHIIPKDTHPDLMFEPQNLCVSCKDCNGEKSNKNILKNRKAIRLPKQSKNYIITHPHFDNYDDHIKIIDSSLYFLPKTDKGRKTVEICGLLRFVYKYSNYENVDLAIKQGISKFTQALLDTSDPAEEQIYLSFIEDLTKQGKELSKSAFLRKFGEK